MFNALNVFLAKWFSKNSPADVPQGRHYVDRLVTLRVKGWVNRGCDYERTPTVSLPAKRTLELFYDYVQGIVQTHQKAAVNAALRQAMKDSIAMNENGDERRERFAKSIEDVAAAEEWLRTILSDLPKVTVKGKTTFDGDVEIVE